MPRRFELLIFDWDGTLMDSAAAIIGSLQAACADLDLPVPSDERARHVIGLGLGDAMRYILPDVDPSEYDQVVQRYRVHYLQRDSGTALFPGASELVSTLRETGFMLAIATGKGRRGLERVLESTGLQGLFHASRCADEGHTKPDPGMLEALFEELGVPRHRALMIGDTTHDMAMAQAAGVARLAVAYGAHSREELLAYEPVACMDDFSGLRRWLLEHA